MIKDLVSKIEEANILYRIGNPIMSDSEYDTLMDQLYDIDPDNSVFTKIGVIINDSRKRDLPITMASMNKIKTVDQLKDWIRIKNIYFGEKNKKVFVLTPKYDGISLCVNEITKESFTRGDGTQGQMSDEHYKLVNNKLSKNDIYHTNENKPSIAFDFTYGEVLIKKSTFSDKYSNYANGRNLVAGLFNSKDISPILKDCDYIKYGGVGQNYFETKHEILDNLNERQSIKVKYVLASENDLTQEYLESLFNEWSIEYEIDGIIIEVDDIKTQERLGRERSSENPCYARAFKSPNFEETSITEVIGLTWTISKHGLLKPVLHLNPVKNQGVTISNVTGNNARFVKEMGLGIGSIVKIKRSGMVIPLITEVIKRVPFILPEGNIKWNDNGIELVTSEETDDQNFKMVVAFFTILEVENLGEGVIKQLWDAGYKSIKDILNVKISDMEKLEGFGKRKSSIIFNNILNKTKGVELSKLQHATSIFPGLGSKKLLLLENFDTKPLLEEIIKIEGFAETSAKIYLDNYDKFYEFIKDLPITINKKTKVITTNNDLDGKSFCFTGVRRADLESNIESRSGKIVSGVTKNTTHLICKDTTSSSSKTIKAKELGITIMNVEELEALLN